MIWQQIPRCHILAFNFWGAHKELADLVRHGHHPLADDLREIRDCRGEDRSLLLFRRVADLEHPESVHESQVLAKRPLVQPGAVAGAGSIAGGQEAEVRVRLDDLPAVLGNHQGRAFGDPVEPRRRGRIQQIQLVEQEPLPIPQRGGQGPVHEHHVPVNQGVVSDEVLDLQPPVCRDPLYRDVQPGRNLAYQGAFPGSGGAVQKKPVSAAHLDPGQQV